MRRYAKNGITASEVLKAGHGICFAKSHLLAALLRCKSVPAGFCYQKVILDDEAAPVLVYHGLNGAYVKACKKWIRLDARGNKPGVDAQFSTETERLAYPIRPEKGEADGFAVYPDPDRAILEKLRNCKTRTELWKHLPTELAYNERRLADFQLENEDSAEAVIMYYSYVMGVGNEIYALSDSGFTIEKFGNSYGVAFPKEKAVEWERFISQYLELGYWNEYLSDDGVIFLFHLEDGLKRYDVKDYKNDEVLSLCEKLCERKFKSIKDMLKENHYYSDKID